MKRLALVVCSFGFLALLTGCDSSVTNFVKKARPAADRTVPPQSNSPNGIKFSPGKLEAGSVDIAAEATVTPTNHFMTGGGMSARIGISRTRVR